MTLAQVGIGPYVKASVLFENEEDAFDLSNVMTTFSWQSFVNNGYRIHMEIADPNLSIFQRLTNEKYLKEARKKPLKIKFSMAVSIGGEEEKKETRTTLAYVTNMESGSPEDAGQSGGFFEMVAIDPLTWFLNRGSASGKVYVGKVSNVVKQVISDYAPGISVDITTTNDNATKNWPMMRMDPKTFIVSLLDWSSSLTNQKTNWVVAPLDETVTIREQAELISKDFGEYAVNTEYPGTNNVIEWYRLDNNYLTNIQTVLSTGGISAVSGLYCDSANSITSQKTIVYDDNTQNKINVDLVYNPDSPQGFLKPRDLDVGWSFVRAIPEDSAGEVGVKYQDYIDGRARGLYLGSLDGLSKLVIKVPGTVLLDNPSNLGVSTIYLTWSDAEGNPWAANAKWLVYGFKHVFTKFKEWFTYIYVNRKDVDSTAKKV